MNVFGFGFLVMVSLVGGLIAVFADNLGRTLGKKRLTFLKMRPRKTAQVFTFAAGAIIPLLSVAAVFFLSADVRRWFAEGPQVVRERDRLSGEVKELGATRGALTAEIARMQTAAKGLTTQISDLRGQLAENQTRLSELTKRKAEVEDRLKTISGRIAILDRQIASAQRDLDLAKSALAATEKNLAVKTREFEELSTKVRGLQRDYDTVSSDLNSQYQENIRLLRENENLEESISTLQGSKGQLETQIADKERELRLAEAEYEKTLGELERTLERVRIDRDEIRSQIQAAQTQLQQILRLSRDISGGSRTQALMYPMGAEIARIQVSSKLTRDSAANELSRLLRAARAEAEDNGAKAYGTTASADIVERVIDGKLVTAEEQIQSIINRLTGLSDDLVLVATSSLNAFKGEPVSIEIQSFRNPIVFTEGTMVAEGRIEGDRPEETIIAQITEFVTKQIRDLARSKGMIPILGQEERYGTLSQNTLIELMRSARANDRRVRIQAFAPKDIRAGDPLTLEFRIR